MLNRLQFLPQMEIVPRGEMNESIITFKPPDFKLDNFKFELRKSEGGNDKFIINQFCHPHPFSRIKKLKENRVNPRYIKDFKGRKRER